MLRYWPIVAVLVLVCGVAFAPAAQAKGNDVQFHGTVLGVEMQSATQGVLTLRVMSFQVPVRLTGDTEIEAHGDEVGLKGISIGDFVKVSGFFTNSTIVAKEVEVLDRGEGEFRLRGPITAVRTSAAGTVITVLGVDVLVDSETKIERRGPSGGFTAANLAAGMLVDTRGDRVEGQFVATRVKVGMREEDDIRVAFAGRITAISTGRLTIDTEGGSTATVLITTATTVVGTPAVGQFAEVRGTLNSGLEVVASRVQIKESRDSDDHPSATSATEFEKEISLTAVGAGATIRGEAEIEIEVEGGGLQQEFKLKISRAQPNTEYRIRVEIASSGQVDFGTFRTNSEGSAEVKFSTSPRDLRRDLRSLLPAGKTVRDFVSVQVLTVGGTVVLQGRF